MDKKTSTMCHVYASFALRADMYIHMHHNNTNIEHDIQNSYNNNITTSNTNNTTTTTTSTTTTTNTTAASVSILLPLQLHTTTLMRAHRESLLGTHSASHAEKNAAPLDTLKVFLAGPQIPHLRQDVHRIRSLLHVRELFRGCLAYRSPVLSNRFRC